MTPTTGPPELTSLPIGQPDRLLALVGRRVRLTNVKIQEVVGDKIFWIGPSLPRRIVTYLEEESAEDGPEGGIDVEAGQVVNMTAEIRRLPSLEEIEDRWDLDVGAIEELRGEQVYLYVDTVEKIRIVGRP